MNPYEPPPRTKWNILNLGAGVQSSTLAMLAARGAFGAMPDAAVFADTGSEPANVYAWLNWLEKQLPFPVHRVRAKRQLEEDTFRTKISKTDGIEYTNWTIPVFTKENGKVNIRRRKCTHNYKIAPLESKLKKIVKRKRGDHDTLICTQWFGISLDEVQRTRINRYNWCQNRYPLIEHRLTRADCLRWMQACDFPRPPRSACVMCPYHSDEEWLRLKHEAPEEFQRAVNFERQYQTHSKRYDIKHLTPFLHRSCVPLDQVQFKSDKANNWHDECEGMCGL